MWDKNKLWQVHINGKATSEENLRRRHNFYHHCQENHFTSAGITHWLKKHDYHLKGCCFKYQIVKKIFL